jgi:hypothetical protein
MVPASTLCTRRSVAAVSKPSKRIDGKYVATNAAVALRNE